jgi:cold-inducible RNA-binding protein
MASCLKEASFMGKKLYVGNLPFSANDQTLQETFSQCGTVESAKVITDRDSGRSKGFGFVEMSSDAEAADAIAKFNGAELDGRAMTVNEARPMEPRSGGGGGFGGGGGRGGDRGGRGGGGGFGGGRGGRY